MREIEQALELLHQALANKKAPRLVVDDVEIAVGNHTLDTRRVVKIQNLYNWRVPSFQVADAHTGVEENSSSGSYDEIADGLLGLMRFINAEDAGCDTVDLEPLVRIGDALQLLELGVWVCAAPGRD